MFRGLGAGLASAAGRTAADPVSDGVEAVPSVFGEVGRRVDTVRYPLVVMLRYGPLLTSAFVLIPRSLTAAGFAGGGVSGHV